MKKLLFTMIATSVFISGCVVSFGETPPPATVGIYKSFDKGENWVEKNQFLHSGGVASINGVSVKELIFDPQDPRAIYLNSKSNGLFFSYDSGDSWQKAVQVGDGNIESVAIDPKNKCVIYASFANTILKSVDCSRNWGEVYIDTRADKLITAIAVDRFNNLVVYAGNTNGDIFKSLDGGSNWRVIERLGNPIKKILVDEDDSRTVYVATQSAGIHKTISAGADWFDVNDGLKPYSGALEFRQLIDNPTASDSLLLISKYGLIQTDDGGETWTPYTLITPPASTDIFSAAINIGNAQEIYYATGSTFYQTFDGGENWVTKRLPSAGFPSYMVSDPVDPNVLFMGMSN